MPFETGHWRQQREGGQALSSGCHLSASAAAASSCPVYVFAPVRGTPVILENRHVRINKSRITRGSHGPEFKLSAAHAAHRPRRTGAGRLFGRRWQRRQTG